MIVAENPPQRRGLHWCVNPSFEQYVSSSATEGKVSTSEGAKFAADATHFFPEDEEQEQTASRSFLGKVSYTAYFGILDVQISAPRLSLEGETTRLLVRDEGSPRAVWSKFGCVPTDAIFTGEITPVTLGTFGAELFMNKYPAGSLVGRVQLIGADQGKRT